MLEPLPCRCVFASLSQPRWAFTPSSAISNRNRRKSPSCHGFARVSVANQVERRQRLVGCRNGQTASALFSGFSVCLTAAEHSEVCNVDEADSLVYPRCNRVVVVKAEMVHATRKAVLAQALDGKGGVAAAPL